MKNPKGRSLSRLSLALVFVCLLVAGRPFAQDQIQKAKIFEDTYQLITDTDLYGSFFMMEEGKPLPDLRIIGAERMNEKDNLVDFDLIYLSKGQADGLEIGQLFQIIGLEDKVPPYGTVTLRRGRARVIRLEEKVAVARIERSYWPARVGDYLLPFEEGELVVGKDKGYDVMDPNATKRGKVIYIDQDLRTAGSGQWVLINMGRQQCVQIGDELTVFHRAKPNLPREAIGSMIIIDVRGATSTVKVLSCKEAVEPGDEVQMNTSR
ncbi:MAG: hypothetical protein ABR951_03205 [Candidatus Aminicenantales bacterium]|jgi:hypothetical protein